MLDSFVNPWTVAYRASLSSTISWSLLKVTSMESVVLSNHLIFPFSFCLWSIFPSIRVFSNESALHFRWPKYWRSLSFSNSPSNEYSGLISFSIDWFDLLAVQGTQEFPPVPQSENMNSSTLLYAPALTSIHDYQKNYSFDYKDLWLICCNLYWLVMTASEVKLG